MILSKKFKVGKFSGDGRNDFDKVCQIAATALFKAAVAEMLWSGVVTKVAGEMFIT